MDRGYCYAIQILDGQTNFFHTPLYRSARIRVVILLAGKPLLVDGNDNIPVTYYRCTGADAPIKRKNIRSIVQLRFRIIVYLRFCWARLT